MKLRCVVSVLVCTAVSCMASLQSEGSGDQLAQKIEKKNLLQRVRAAKSGDKEVERILLYADKLLEDAYESEERSIVDSQNRNLYGSAFPINPEVLAALMDSSQGTSVLELAAAGGENAILLGLAGAQEVYINELEPKELRLCQERLDALPASMSGTFTLVPGDCLEVFESDDYTNKFDVIYVRHLVDFFFGEKRQHFIDMVYRLLKPGGRLIVSTSSPYSFRKMAPSGFFKEIKRNPDAYVFAMKHFRLDNRALFLRSMKVIKNPVNVDPLRFYAHLIVEFCFQKITISEKCPLFGLSQKDIDGLISIVLNSYDVRSSHLRLYLCQRNIIAYTRRTLNQAFSGAGFEMLYAVSTDASGHSTANVKREKHLTAVFQK